MDVVLGLGSLRCKAAVPVLDLTAKDEGTVKSGYQLRAVPFLDRTAIRVRVRL